MPNIWPTILRGVLCISTNCVLYILYFALLIASVVAAECNYRIRRLISKVRAARASESLTAVVTRGKESMGVIGAAFGAIVLIVNIGIAQVIFRWSQPGLANSHS